MQLDSFVFSSQGGQDHNEDTAEELEFSAGSLYIVADGLGGHRYGERASRCVTESLLSANPPADDPVEWLQTQLAQANERLCRMQEEEGCTMKSTAAVLLIQGRRAFWAHVGDSRIYYLHRGRIADITEDHSVALKKYKAGEITRAQIATDEDQASLLRAMGNRDRAQPTIGWAPGQLESGDGFLLCSDGLWKYVRDEEVLVDLLKSGSAQDWAELLLLRVMGRITEGNDNLSLITVMVC